MILKDTFKTDLRVLLLLLAAAVLGAHRIMLDAYVHHPDWFIIYKVMAHGRHWLEQTGALPLWAPFYTGGISYTSNIPLVLSAGQLMAFAGVSATFASYLLEFASIALAGVCVYLLSRDLGLERGAALCAAILHQYFTATWVSTENYPAGLIALSFFLCERYERRGNFAYVLLNALAVGLFGLTAIPHGLLIAVAFQWLVALVRAADGTGRRFALATAVSTTLGLALALPSLLPAARDAAQSYRIYFIRPDFNLSGLSFDQAIRHVVTVGFQASTLGAGLFVAVVLTVWAGFFRHGRPLDAIYRTGVTGMLLLAAACLGQGLVAGVPVVGKLLNAFDMQRNVVTPFCAALFSGLCVQALAQERPTPGRPLAMWAVLAALLALWLVVGNRFREYTLLAAAGLGLYLWAQTRASQEVRQRLVPWLAVAMTAFLVLLLAQSHVKDSLAVARKMKLSPLAAVYDDGQLKPRTEYDLGESPQATAELLDLLAKGTEDHSRVMDRDVFNYPQRTFLLVHDLTSMHFFDNTSTARYRELFMWMVDDLRLTDPKLYRNLWHTSTMYGKSGSRFNEAVLSVGGVRWIMAPKDLPEERFERVWTGQRVALYRNPKAFPKAFAVFGVDVVADKEAMARRIISATPETLAASVPLRAEDAADFPQGFLSGQGEARVRLARYTPYEAVVDVEASENCVLVLGDSIHPIWKAEVDGSAAKIFPAYNTFRMVAVPHGRHTVRFYAQDELFAATAKASLGLGAGLILALGAVLAVRRRRA